MSPELGVAIMMNNYFHDVATALLAASGAAMWIMYRHYEKMDEPKPTPYFAALFRSMSRLAVFSLVWILLGGVPRVVFYTEFEWANAAGRSQVPALVVKHVLMFVLVGGGLYAWHQIRKRLKPVVAGGT